MSLSNSRRKRRTGNPDVLYFMELLRVEPNLVTEQQERLSLDFLQLQEIKEEQEEHILLEGEQKEFFII